ncbi:MAG TPA: hypothetical protein VLE53_04700 [Gemmatimonadaceae bacterium]|nr:hypothetical protein [Gemmatimonadaceae bacterium]
MISTFTSRSARLLPRAAMRLAATTTIVLSAAACSDGERPTAPTARPTSLRSQAPEAQAARGDAGGTKTYGIRAHGTVFAYGSAAPPIIGSDSRNLLGLTQPSNGFYCIQLPADLLPVTVIVSVRGVGFATAGLNYTACGGANRVGVLTYDPTGAVTNSRPFDIVIP